MLLGAGLLAGVYLIQNRTNILPKAGGGISKPITPAVGLTVESDFDTYVGREVAVSITARSDFDSANLFVAKLKFDKDLLRVSRIDTNTGFIINWVEQHYDNNTGEISLTGGIPPQGIQTQVGGAGQMALIYFVALKEGKAAISFTDGSAIYRNYDNSNVIGFKKGATITIDSSATQITPTPSTELPKSVELARQDLAKMLGVDSSQITVVKTEEVDWNNSSLGCPKPGMMYTQAIVPGYKVIFSYNQKMYEYHTNKTDRFVTCQSPPTSSQKATLSLDPSDGTLNRGCNFSLNVNVDTGGAQTDGTDAILLYDPSKLTATSIANGTIYADYPADDIDSKNGKITISGLASVSTPVSGKSTFATVNFTIPASAADGATQVTFDFDPNNKAKSTDSNVVQRGTVVDVLNSVVNGKYTIGTGTCDSQTSGHQSGSGDGNNDGKIDLSDLSILFTYLNNTKGYKGNIDLNGDGVINVVDFGLMRNLLIQKGVVKR